MFLPNNKKRKITPGSLVAAPGLLFFNFKSGPEHTKVHLSTCAVQKKPEPLERREVEKAASFDGQTEIVAEFAKVDIQMRN